MKIYFLCLCLSLNLFLTLIIASKTQYDCKDDDRVEEINKCICFHGTNLFGKYGYPNKCFTAQQVALLTTLRIFQLLIPRDFPRTLIDDNFANSLINYFYQANSIILKEIKDHEAQRYAEMAFYDTVGGYLNYYLIPLTRYSFYAGTLSLEIAQKLMRFHRHCREYLNTNGNGWLAPIETKPMCKIGKIDLKAIKEEHCSQLIPCDDTNNENMLISLPKLECEQNEYLTHIWLPFKHKKWYNLQSDYSAYIIFKYFVIASKCYLDEEMSDNVFQDNFKLWYRENLEIHLNDTVLYPAFGALLRVIETINSRNNNWNMFAKKNVKEKFNDNKKLVEYVPDKNNMEVSFKHDGLTKRQEKNWIEVLVDKKMGEKKRVTYWDHYKTMSIKAAAIGAGSIAGTALIWWLAKRWFIGLFLKKKKVERFEGGLDYPYQPFVNKPDRRHCKHGSHPDGDDDDDEEDLYYYDEEETLYNRKCSGQNSEQTNNRLTVHDEINQKKAAGNQIIISSLPHTKKTPKKHSTLRQFMKQCSTYSKEPYNLMSDDNVNSARCKVSEIKKPPNRMETSSSESSNSLKKFTTTRIPRKIETMKITDNVCLSEPGPSPKPKTSFQLDKIIEKPDTKHHSDSNNRGKATKIKIIKTDIKSKTKEPFNKKARSNLPFDKKSIGRTTSWETDLEN